MSWVNILRDPDAAQFVASRHDGDENVPTAVTGMGETLEATVATIKAHVEANRLTR